MEKQTMYVLIIIVLVMVALYFMHKYDTTSKVYKDGKMKVALLKDGCRTVVPFDFEFKGPGDYFIPGYGNASILEVYVNDKQRLLGPGAETPSQFLPSSDTPFVGPVTDFGRNLGRTLLDFGETGRDFLLNPEQVQGDLDQLRQDVQGVPQNVQGLVEGELQDVQELTGNGLSSLVLLDQMNRN